MPLTFEALKRQRFRWCFGGIQILRMHGHSLMPWSRDPGNRLTLRQRWAYFVGGLQWYGDLAALAFLGFLMVGAGSLLFGDGVVVRRLSGFLLLALVVLVVLGAVRALAVLRRMRGASWGETIGAFGLWLGLTWAVAQGAFRGSFARKGEFLRTPKDRPDLGWRDALRGNRLETVVGVVCAVVATALFWTWSPIGAAMGLLLLLQALGYLAAPANSWAAIRSVDESDRPRLLVGLRSWTGPVAVRRVMVWPAAAGAVLIAAAITFASPADAPLGAEAVEKVDEVDDEEAEREPPRRPATPRPTTTVSPDGAPVTGGDVSTEPGATDPAGTPAPESAPAPASAPTPAPAPAPTPAPAPSPAPAPAPDQPASSGAKPTDAPTPTTAPTTGGADRAPTGRP